MARPWHTLATMSEDLFEKIVALRRERAPAALCTVVATKGSTPAKVPARMLAGPLGRLAGTIGGGCIEADVLRIARDVIDTGRPRSTSFHLVGEEAERTGIACGGIVEIMIEPLEDPRVVIVGAGHVGQAVAGLASAVGFRVTVVDDRPDFANEERFPTADEVVVAELEQLGDAVRIGRQTWIRIMTRGHAEDLGVLRWALTTEARDVGVLGSKSKRLNFLKTLRAEGVAEDVLETISMPVGLDLGAESVDEIAVSIVAELVQTRRKGADATVP